MTRRTLAIAWLALLVLTAVELGAALLRFGVIAPAIGIVMAVLVAFLFMRVREAPALSRIFALAGVFWLILLLGLTSLDTFTRSDYPAPLPTEPGE
jgi:cytochrome c oxidase subunit IV